MNRRGLLAREPAAVVVGVVELVRVTLGQADKRAALDRARRAAAGKAQVEAEVDAELRAQGRQGCFECDGRTIEFRGSGSIMEYRLCSRYREPGHLSATEIGERIAVETMTERPSGRFA